MSSNVWNGKLLNAEEQHEKHPDTFNIPPRSERCRLEPGEIVKLAFILDAQAGDGFEGERMWVKIVSCSGVVVDNTFVAMSYSGKLMNVPSRINMDRYASDFGYMVTFGPEHVLDVYEPENRVYRINAHSAYPAEMLSESTKRRGS